MRNRLASQRHRFAGRFPRAQRGFSLIELMLVVVIIGILVSFAYPYYSRFNARARRSEALIVLNKLNTYFINLYENNGTYGVSLSSSYDPNPATATLGQAAKWDSTIAGWTQVPFAFDGGLKMRYIYTTASDGSSMTITVEGSVPGLGPTVSGAGLGGNYLFIETLTGPNVTTVEVPSM